VISLHHSLRESLPELEGVREDFTEKHSRRGKKVKRRGVLCKRNPDKKGDKVFFTKEGVGSHEGRGRWKVLFQVGERETGGTVKGEETHFVQKKGGGDRAYSGKDVQGRGTARILTV